MKLRNWLLKCPVLFLLLFSWMALFVYTCSEGKVSYALSKDVIQTPVFTALLDSDKGALEYGMENSLVEMAVLADGTACATPDEPGGTQNAGQGGEPAESVKGQDRQVEAHCENEETLSEVKAYRDNPDKVQKAQAGITRYKKYEKEQTDSPYYTDPGKKALTTEYAYQKVDAGYFADAVFIGDSRTVGMQDYSGLEDAAFFAKTGLNIYRLLEDEFVEDPSSGKTCSVSHMLKKNKYGKIYLMVGINELGTGNTGTFQEAYRSVLQKIRKWQPKAVVYIQGIIPVSKTRSLEDEIFNNVNINDKNVAISELADGKDIFYLDVSGKLTDKEGFLKADYTFDEIHMYAQYYSLWAEYLMEHAVVR